MSERIHYIIIRRDLPFGVTLAQVGHAAAESAFLTNAQIEKDTICVLGVRDERTLLKLHKKMLRKHFCKHVAIYEPDYGNQLMAIGVVPGNRKWLSHYFKKLNTYKEFNVPLSPDRVTLTTDHLHSRGTCLIIR